MTMSWKRMETANGAGVEIPCAAACGASATSSRVCRALRWKRDAVCGYAPADEDLLRGEAGAMPEAAADFPGSSLTRTIFFTSRIQTKTQTRKETNYNTQGKKGKQTENQSTNSLKLQNLA